ncbi:pyridoxal kinase PdxY [Canibacter sp. lx-72]|uniref:pyridoxal kinase PdxY n=1 Tax=Canibacter zhuwentaonis TaxID=2837491 RepID=UPI001BDC3F3D|nr:pyridoxal kinase PdxY [Canibacter zhuwentaonis]MBT1017778.1 pyridoxal kinase PdxY [Canibacter zhuwentaonis]
MRILSIQSAVSYGHVGNSAAVFPLQRLGHEVMPVATVCFSNHTGYGDWQGVMFNGEQVRDIVAGIDKRGALADTELIISGYQGGSSIGDAILDTVAKTKARNPRAVYSCDPVLGNENSGCFVSPEVQELIRDRVIQHADIITPNQFELGFLTRRELNTLADTLDAIKEIQRIGPQTVLVTSVNRADAQSQTLEMLAVNQSEAWLISTPRLPGKINGSGDVTQALFAAHLSSGKSLRQALELTTASVFELLTKTLSAGSKELLLIEAQEAYVAPARSFTARQIDRSSGSELNPA